ncbi:MAG: hypothetical protein ACLPVF_16665 [Acidimicrobiales bacterium]
MTYVPDEDETRERLRRIRAERGSPEQLARLEALKQQAEENERRKKAAASGRKNPDNSTSMYGHPWPYWFQMRDTAMEVISEAAAKGELVHYGDLWKEIERRLGANLGDRWIQMPNLLGYVSDHFHEEIGALPTAVVVSQGTPPKPEQGFFMLAVARGYLPQADAPREGEDWKVMTPRQEAFWEEQVLTVFRWAAARFGKSTPD